AGVSRVRRIEEIRIHARNDAKRRAFADELRKGGSARIVECESVEQAIDGADVVGTATASSEPLSSFEHLAPHVHVNCMGGHTALGGREIPRAVLEASRLIVEDVTAAVEEAGGVHARAMPLGALPGADRGALRRERTIFSSTGHAFLDLITVAHVLGAPPHPSPPPKGEGG
ncbi:MAG TPA: hypothetical protein VNO21_02815, partial [Polyangiaceae bacterium]|nr:hypothetical protein [Polyangiaceae bacterium]